MAQWNEEMNTGKVFVETLIKERGQDYAQLVTKVTLAKAQVLARVPAGATADALLDSILSILFDAYDKEHPIAVGAEQEFMNEVHRLSDEFLDIGTKAAEAAKTRAEVGGGDGEGFAASGAEAEGSV